MKTNNKKFIFILSFLLIFTLFGQITVAANKTLEVKNYPSIPGLPTITVDSDLADYVGYIFGLITYIAGVIAVISFAVGAVQLIMAASNPSLVNEAKDRMKGSVLGLVLTLSAIVILRTINPQIVSTTLTPLSGVDGIYYKKGADLKPAPNSESNTSNIPDGYKTLFYKCTKSDIAPYLLVWVFNKKDFDYTGGVSTQRVACNGTVGLESAGSFKMSFETPGIYYCTGTCNGNMCSGYMSEANTTTQNEIETPFKGNIKAVRIVNNPNKYDYYGIIFHKEIGAGNGGECSTPITTDSDEIDCKNLSAYNKSSSFSAFSANIFNWNKNFPVTSGDGVDFYSSKLGWSSSKESGVSSIKKDLIEIQGDSIVDIDAKDISFDYTGVYTNIASVCGEDYTSCDRMEEEYGYSEEGECCPCATPQNYQGSDYCRGSLRISGNYLVAFYTNYKEEVKGDNNTTKTVDKLYCQTYTQSVDDLSLKNFLPSGGNKLEYVNIIPTK